MGCRSILWGTSTVHSLTKGVRGRADVYEIAGHTLLAASLDDIIQSKRAAGREKRDLAVIGILEKTHAMKKAAAKETRKHGVGKKHRSET